MHSNKCSYSLKYQDWISATFILEYAQESCCSLLFFLQINQLYYSQAKERFFLFGTERAIEKEQKQAYTHTVSVSSPHLTFKAEDTKRENTF